MTQPQHQTRLMHQYEGSIFDLLPPPASLSSSSPSSSAVHVAPSPRQRVHLLTRRTVGDRLMSHNTTNNDKTAHISPKSSDVPATSKPIDAIATEAVAAAATPLASKQLVVEMLVPGMATAPAQEGGNSSRSTTETSNEADDDDDDDSPSSSSSSSSSSTSSSAHRPFVYKNFHFQSSQVSGLTYEDSVTSFDTSSSSSSMSEDLEDEEDDETPETSKKFDQDMSLKSTTCAHDDVVATATTETETTARAANAPCTW